MKTASFYLFTVVMATCLVCVEDQGIEGTCKWTCDTKSKDITPGELRKLISRGRLIRLQLQYTAGMDEACENETLQAYENTSSTIVWLTMSNGSSGALDLLSRLVYEEMYFFRIIFFGYKYIHVSCTLQPLTRDYSSQSSIKDPQSVVDLVVQFANRGNTSEKFLIFMRRGENIHVTLDVSSGNSSGASARHRELIVSGQLGTKFWLVAYVLFIIVIVLYINVMVLAFRPSEIVGKKSSLLSQPVPESDFAESHRQPRSQTQGKNDPSYMPTNEGERVAKLPSENYDVTTVDVVTPSDKTSQHSPKHGSSPASSTTRTDNANNDRSRCEGNNAPGKKPVHNDDVAVHVGTDGQSGDSFDREEKHLDETHKSSGNLPKKIQDEVRMILVCTDPIGLGSWIGNCLFISSPEGRNESKSLDRLKDIARYFLCYFSPVLLISGFGDLSLFMLKFYSSRLDDFPSNSLTVSIFTNTRIIMAIVFLFFQCLLFYFARELPFKRDKVWRPCFVHSNHFWFICHLKCFYYPCGKCMNSFPGCPAQIDIPNSIVHNMEKVTESFLRHCEFLVKQLTDFKKTRRKVVQKVILVISLWIPLLIALIIAALIINFFADILLSSPMVCPCQPRMWLFREIFKGKFRGPRLDIVWDIFEALFRLAFFTFLLCYSMYDAIYIVNACIGFTKLMSTNFPNQLHKHVLVLFFVYYYCFSSYFCFKAYYCKLVQELYKSYKKKYDEMQAAKKPIELLVNYKQGDYTAIEYKLFQFAIHRIEIEMPRNRVGALLAKLGCMSFIFVVIFQVSSTPYSGYIVFSVLIAMYKLNNYINNSTFDLLELYADQIVDDFINMKN